MIKLYKATNWELLQHNIQIWSEGYIRNPLWEYGVLAPSQHHIKTNLKPVCSWIEVTRSWLSNFRVLKGWPYWLTWLEGGAHSHWHVPFLEWQWQSAGPSYLKIDLDALYSPVFMQASPSWAPQDLLRISLINLKCSKWKYLHSFWSCLGEKLYKIHFNYRLSHPSIFWPTEQISPTDRRDYFRHQCNSATSLQRTMMYSSTEKNQLSAGLENLKAMAILTDQ